jgi:hypothetical protein
MAEVILTLIVLILLILFALGVVAILMVPCFRFVRTRTLRVYLAVGASVLASAAVLLGLPITAWAFYDGGSGRSDFPGWDKWLGFAALNAILAAGAGIVGGLSGLFIGWTVQRNGLGRSLFGAIKGTMFGLVGALALSVVISPLWVIWTTVVPFGGFIVGAMVGATWNKSRSAVIFDAAITNVIRILHRLSKAEVAEGTEIPGSAMPGDIDAEIARLRERIVELERMKQQGLTLRDKALVRDLGAVPKKLHRQQQDPWIWKLTPAAGCSLRWPVRKWGLPCGC